MARKIVFACFLLLVFSVAFRAQTAALPTSFPPPPHLQPLSSLQTGVTVEKYIVDYAVNADGTCVQTVETDRRLNSRSFSEKLKKYELQFNAGLQEVEVLEAGIIKANGKKIVLPRSSIRIEPTAQAEAAPMFSSLKSLTVDFGGLEVGDLTHLKLRFNLTKPLIEGHFSAVETFPALSQWNWVEINVTAPRDFPLAFEAIGFSGGKLADVGIGGGGGGERARWQWKTKIETAVGYEAGALNYTDNGPRLAMSSFKNYDVLGAAYWATAKEKSSVTPEIQKLADEITRGIAGQPAQAAAIYRWVNKNIRYLLIFQGRGGFIPRAASTTLANRYGDCKDYTNLIQTLLKAKGIESHPVLIHADTNFWLPKIPVSDYFNHAILYIPGLDLYADATAPQTRLGLLPQALYGKTALLAGEKTGLIKIPEGKPEENKFQTVTTIGFQPDGSLKANAKNTYKGTLEGFYRSLFADSEPAQSELFFRGAYAHYGYAGSGKIVRGGNAFQTNEPFTIEFESNLENYISFAKPTAFKVPAAVSLNNILDLEKLVSLLKRKTPLLTGAINFDENFEIRFPKGVKIEAVPAGKNFENSAGTFRSQYRLENNVIFLRRELIILKDVFQPNEYAALRDLVLKAVSDAKNEIRVSPTRDFLVPKTTAKALPGGGGKLKEGSPAMTEAVGGNDAPVTSRRRAVQLEESLKENPDDAELRRKLIDFYTLPADKLLMKRALLSRGQKQKNAFENYKWFVQNHPDLNRKELGGAPDVSSIGVRDPEYRELKDEWLKQVEARKNETVVRLNAVDFFSPREWPVAEKLLVDGEQIDAENYRLPLKLIEIYEDQAEDAESDEVKKAFSAKIFEKGERALNLLKLERTRARDKERGNLLPKLARIAYDLGHFEKAKACATELILEFGDNSSDIRYGESVHTGNIILGKIALAEKNLTAAKEYLLIAARASLRARDGALIPDAELPKMLLDEGEKTSVLEYLKLCEGLKDANVKMLQRWQREIEQNQMPDFDWTDFEIIIEARFKPNKNVPRRKS